MDEVKNMFVVIFFALVVTGSTVAQEKYPKLCGTRSTSANAPAFSDTGGIYMTAKGTMRVLIVFASFPDDSTPHPYWHRHQPPQFMQQFIDPDTLTRSSSPNNLTNYFRQMSLGKLNLIGEAIWIESTHSQEEYREGAYGRANKHLLQEQADPLIDFRQYDQWRKISDYNHVKTRDSLVDMIIMVWRTNMFEYVGEASLGYWPGFTVDGIRIENGYPAYIPLPRGSGVTCQYLYGDTPYKLMQTMAHELGHWLLGKPHPYNGDEPGGKHAYWGMLCSNQRVASCINSYERERLGWIVVPEIPSGRDIALADNLTTGRAYKYHPVNGGPFEYFYIENHQQVSAFDDVTTNPDDRGIWILHQQAPYSEEDNFRITPSDGSWRWRNPGSTTQCSAQAQPVFEKGVPCPAGLSHRDQIPNGASALNWLQAFRDPSDTLRCGRFSTGEQFDGSFDLSKPVFSPYSNPNTNTWLNQQTSFALEIVGEANGAVTVRSHANPLDGPPARRYLGKNPSATQSLSLAWGGQWADGQALESDVNWSELQKQIGNDGNWVSVYQGASTGWLDTTTRYDSSGTIPVLFRARVRDTQGKFSTWSNIHYAAMISPNSVASSNAGGPTTFALMQNYPNPFNPTTEIRFQLPEAGHVTLKVFDVLGKEVATLLNEPMMRAGEFRVVWDGRASDGLPASSGVYLYRMQAGAFTAVKKMALIR